MSGARPRRVRRCFGSVDRRCQQRSVARCLGAYQASLEASRSSWYTGRRHLDCIYPGIYVISKSHDIEDKLIALAAGAASQKMLLTFT